MLKIEELYYSCAAVGSIANAVPSSELAAPAGNDHGLVQVFPTDCGSMERFVLRRGLTVQVED